MFDYQELMALKDLVVGDEEDQSEAAYYKGSMLSPADIAAESGKKKELAKPYSKLEAKIGAKYEPEPVLAKPKPEAPKPAVKNAIWQPEQVPVLPVVKDDSRPAPEFEVLHRQLVGTEDVYLGLSDMDPSSTRCQELTMKIKLPGVEHKQIQVDLTATSLVLQTPRHYLHHFFPYRVRDKQAKAKWVSDKNLLELFLPIQREFP